MGDEGGREDESSVGYCVCPQPLDNRKGRSDRQNITTPIRSQFAHISAVIRRAFRAAPDRVRRQGPTPPAPPLAPPREPIRGAPLTQLPHRVARELIASRVADAEQRRLGRRAA